MSHARRPSRPLLPVLVAVASALAGPFLSGGWLHVHEAPPPSVLGICATGCDDPAHAHDGDDHDGCAACVASRAGARALLTDPTEPWLAFVARACGAGDVRTPRTIAAPTREARAPPAPARSLS